MAAEQALGFFRRLLETVYEEPAENLADLHRAGFRIWPPEEESALPHWREDPLPSWTAPYCWRGGHPVGAVKYLLTFRPFGRLPAAVRRAYLAGNLHLLPFPGSLLFWGVPASQATPTGWAARSATRWSGATTAWAS